MEIFFKNELTDFSHYLNLPELKKLQNKNGRLAQLGERYPYKVDVGGSIPSTPTILFNDLRFKKFPKILKNQHVRQNVRNFQEL